MFLIYPVDVGPASMLVGNLVAGKRIAQATGRELGVVEDQDLIRKVLNPNHHIDPKIIITRLTMDVALYARGEENGSLFISDI